MRPNQNSDSEFGKDDPFGIWTSEIKKYIWNSENNNFFQKFVLIYNKKKMGI